VLRVHTRDGLTASIDLGNKGQAERLAKRLGDPRFQAEITAMTLTHLGVSYTLARPEDSGPVSFLAEVIEPSADRKIKGGQRVMCLAGDMRTTVLVHHAHRAARVSMFRTGKQRFSPLSP